jgi:hypothetical protein
LCSPPDEECAARLAVVGVPPALFGRPVRPKVYGSRVRSAAHEPRRAAELIAARETRSPRRPRDVMRWWRPV